MPAKGETSGSIGDVVDLVNNNREHFSWQRKGNLNLKRATLGYFAGHGVNLNLKRDTWGHILRYIRSADRNMAQQYGPKYGQKSLEITGLNEVEGI